MKQRTGLMKSWHEHPTLVTGLVMLVITAVLVITLRRPLPSLQFKPFNLETFSTALTPLLVIAVLIERTVEVFFGITREPRDREVKEKRENAVEALKRLNPAGAGRMAGAALALAASDSEELRAQAQDLAGVPVVAPAEAAARTALAEATEEQNQREADATHIAFVTSLALGVAAAILGARVMALLTTASPTATDPYYVGYVIVDVVLSAGLLAGGADGFHHLTSVLRLYLEAVQKRAKDQARDPVPGGANA